MTSRSSADDIPKFTAFHPKVSRFQHSCMNLGAKHALSAGRLHFLCERSDSSKLCTGSEIDFTSFSLETRHGTRDEHVHSV
eukprot:6180535-Pleurochrysis_carterae.AAC.3